VGTPQRHAVGGAAEFAEGAIVPRRVAGVEVILIRRLGQIQCYLDQCSHQPIKLSEFGEVSAGRLVCHAHGGTFDLDAKGRVVCDPPVDALTPVACAETSGQVFVIL
jgi:nitrite reductase/ring-hydroxylating ferredoxin subunit